MNCLDQRIGKIFNGPPLSRQCIGRVVLIGAGLLAGTGLAHSGPLHGANRAARAANRGHAGRAADRSKPRRKLWAHSLHFQPTPDDVAHAQRVANKDGEAAIARAKAADAAGDAAGCKAALAQAKDLYAINQ